MSERRTFSFNPNLPNPEYDPPTLECGRTIAKLYESLLTAAEPQAAERVAFRVLSFHLHSVGSTATWGLDTTRSYLYWGRKTLACQTVVPIYPNTEDDEYLRKQDARRWRSLKTVPEDWDAEVAQHLPPGIRTIYTITRHLVSLREQSGLTFLGSIGEPTPNGLLEYKPMVFERGRKRVEEQVGLLRDDAVPYLMAFARTS